MKNIINKIKKQIYDVLPKTDRHGFNYTVNELVGMWTNSNKMSESWHGEIISNKILNYKKSDTIFILGSGPSINEITPKQWIKIKQHDSIGFNYWFAHKFIPTFYMFQGAYDNMLELLKDRYEDYKNIPFLIRGSHFALGDFNTKDYRLNLLKNNPVYYINEYPFHSRCSIEINKLIQYTEALGMMSFGEISNFIPKWKVTLGLIISLSYQMGYKHIVLCGMDMKNSSHFWDEKQYAATKKKYSLPDIGKANINTFNNVKLSSNTVEEYIYQLNKWMFEKNKVEITIANKNTVLYPKLKVYPFE